MSEKYINVDLNDERAGKIAEVIGNKTCMKILDALAEKEMSAGEISDELGMAMNTIGYNIEKLVDSGLVEKKKEFLWSVKGKRVMRYKVANKKIVISPAKKIRGLLSTLVISGLIGIGLKVWSDSKMLSVKSLDYAAAGAAESTASGASAALMEKAPEAVNTGRDVVVNIMQVGNPASWFIIGVIVALIIIALFNWRKVWK